MGVFVTLKISPFPSFPQPRLIRRGEKEAIIPPFGKGRLGRLAEERRVGGILQINVVIILILLIT